LGAATPPPLNFADIASIDAIRIMSHEATVTAGQTAGMPPSAPHTRTLKSYSTHPMADSAKGLAPDRKPRTLKAAIVWEGADQAGDTVARARTIFPDIALSWSH
jgi:hypothetical protein